ncbi:MAG: PAS domain S-box protein, partial [Candidatus Binatia bacterium]
GTVRVLLIADNEDDYILIRELLAEIDDTRFEIDWHCEYDAGRAALQSQSHDVCLLDYRKGADKGLALLREANAAGCATPVIVMSGHGDRHTDLLAMPSGAFYYLDKATIDTPLLERTIRYALELRRAEHRARVSEARTRAVLDHAVDGIITMDQRGVVESFNPAAARIFGYRPDEVIGRELTMLMAGPQRAAHLRQLAEYLRTGVAKVIGVPREVTGRRRDGSDVHLDLAVSEMWIDGQRTFIGWLRDITERTRDDQLLRARARQHEVLAELGGLGLSGGETASVFDEAVRLVAETLDTPLSSIAELLPDGHTLRLAAGVGWQAGLVGAATVSTNASPLLREVAASRQTTVISRLEHSAPSSPLLRAHGAVSLVSVPIHDRGELLGMLGVATTEFRDFRADEVRFLEGVSALLGQAMQRRRAEAALRESEQRRQLIVDAANIGLWDWDIVAGTVYYSDWLG